MNVTNFLHIKKNSKPAYSSEHVSWRERLGEDAYVGWAVIVSISFFIMLILVGYAGWLFFLVGSGSITDPQAMAMPSDRSDFNQKSLDSLIATFNKKAETTSSIMRGWNGPANPSQ